MSQNEISRIDPLRARLAGVVSDTFTRLQVEPNADRMSMLDVYKMIERPPESAMGDYALPCFRFAKVLRKKPDLIASDLKAALDAQGLSWVSSIDAVGAFCNFHLRAEDIASEVIPAILNGDFFEVLSQSERSKTRVMIEFACPNTHKEFHVGHGRNICLGDGLVRLFRYAGYDVVAANYPGDEGAHIAKCLWYIKRCGQPLPDVNQGPWLSKMYAEAERTLQAAADEVKQRYLEEISEVLSSIESKAGPDYELWQKTRQWSLDEFERIFRFMDIEFDQYFYESELSNESQQIVDEYLEKGVFVVDDGAVGIDLSDAKLGFSILRKRDGNTLYATKDLALARRKFRDHGIDRSINVVGSEQQLHFKQVFKTLEKMGFPQAARCFHLSYGLVTLPEGKMSSRAGTSITFQTLVDNVLAGLRDVLKRYESEPDWTKEDIERTAHLLCVGAIRYGMLNADPNKNIIFNLQEWLSFEGNSGPYVMYTYARIQSILRKAQESGFKEETNVFSGLQGEVEKELINYLHDFNLVAIDAAENYRPNHMLHHVYHSARAFNRFYSHVSVLKAESDELRAQRLSLIAAYALMLRQGLNLLGITPPERM